MARMRGLLPPRVRAGRPAKPWSIAGRVFVIQAAAALLIGGVLVVALVADARQRAEEAAAALSLTVCHTIAEDPAVRAALASANPTTALEPYTLDVARSTGVDFITVMNTGGIRLTHPDPTQIGKPFLGTITAAQAGRTITETYTGTLGPSVRAVVPITDAAGTVVGIVAAGVTTAAIGDQVLPRIPTVVAIALLAVGIGAAAAAITRASLRRTTGRMSAPELRRMVGFYESVLHAVREGVVLTDADRRVVLYNDEAADLLDLPPASAGAPARTAAELGVDPAIAALLDDGRRVVEEVHAAGSRVLLVNQEPAHAAGATAASQAGAVMTLRDQSMLESLAGELASVRTMTDALRSQTHEHANTLHTVAALIELDRGEEAVALIAAGTRSSQELTDRMLDDSGDPVLAALLVGKAAQAAERGIAFEVALAPEARMPLPPAAVVTVAGNLVDNALDAAAAGPAPRSVRVALERGSRVGERGGSAGGTGGGVVLRVEDSGRGPDLASRDPFAPGVTSKSAPGHGVGLALVRRVVSSAGGSAAFEPGRPTAVVVRLPDTGRDAGSDAGPHAEATP